MAPKTSEPADKTITISYEKYMSSQNELINALTQHYKVASNMMMASTQSAATIMTAISRVRESTKSVLMSEGVDTLPTGLESYPALSALLTKGENELMDPLAMPTFDIATGKKIRKKRAPKDPNAPKRPQTAFFLYLEHNRDKVKTEMGEAVKPGDVAKAQRERWSALPESDKETYRATYRANFEGYKKEVEAFKARGGKVPDEDLHPADEDADVVLPDAGGPADADSDGDSDDDSEDSEVVKTPTPQPPPAKKGRKPKAPAKAAESKKAEAAAAKIDPPIATTEKPKSPVKKKGKGASAAATPAAATPAEKKKGKESAKAVSPEDSTKTKPAESPEASKKKRKSTGAELEEKRKKRKEAHGDDF